MNNYCRWIMVALILTALMLASCEQMDQETTVYYASCKGEMKGQICKGIIAPEARISFKVSVSRQEVLYWHEGLGIINKLSNCTVRNKDYWNCSYGKQMWIMDNGDFRTYPPEPDEKWFVISKYRWWAVYLREWLKDLTAKIVDCIL